MQGWIRDYRSDYRAYYSRAFACYLSSKNSFHKQDRTNACQLNGRLRQQQGWQKVECFTFIQAFESYCLHSLSASSTTILFHSSSSSTIFPLLLEWKSFLRAVLIISEIHEKTFMFSSGHLVPKGLDSSSLKNWKNIPSVLVLYIYLETSNFSKKDPPALVIF